MDRVVTHPNGKPQRPEDYEAGKMRLASFPRCDGCDGRIEADRLKFLENRKVPKESRAWSLCKDCAFFEKHNVSPDR